MVRPLSAGSQHEFLHVVSAMSSAGIFGSEGAEQVLAVQVLLGLDGPGVYAQQPARCEPQVPVQARPGGDDAAQFGPLVPAERVQSEADDEPLVPGDPDFLDLQVRGDVLVAALPRQRRRRPGRAGAELFPDDVVVPALAQVAGSPPRRTRGRRPR